MTTGAMTAMMLFVLLAIAFAPALLFWSIAVLFDHHIDVTFKTWIAAHLLMVLLTGTRGSSK